VQVDAAQIPALNSLLTLAAGVVAVAALYFAREVLIPITLAVLLAFVLAPVGALLRRLYFGRALSSVVSVLLALGALLALGGLIGMQLADLATQMPRYQYTIERKIDAVRSATIGRLSTNLHNLGFESKAPAAAPAASPATKAQPTPAKGDAEQKPMPVEVHQPDPSPMDMLERFATPILGPLGTTGLVFIVAIFIQLQREDLRDRMIRLFGSRDLHRTTVAMNDAAKRLSRYFLMQLSINAGFGIILGFGLWMIGIPSAALWGVLGALLRFVPYVGAPLAAILPLTLAAAVDPGWSMMLWTAALFFVLEMTVAQALEPLLYGHSTGLSPFSVVIAATFWIWLWGPIGLILSTPLTLCLVVLGRHVERLEFLEVLLGDRPALTPVEGFYQRILAGDPDEVQDQAEILLKERSLSSYYDEVALKGLQLASRDATRGVLQEKQIERMKTTITAVIEDLDSYDDIEPEAKEPRDDGPIESANSNTRIVTKPGPADEGRGTLDLRPEWQTGTPVLVIAGRGSLDEPAAFMLAQLLTKHGIAAHVAGSDTATRMSIASLPTDGVRMVCLCYLELGGHSSHMRYLVRRLRQRMANTPILVTLWPSDNETFEDERSRNAIAADHYAANFRDAVATCLEAAHMPEATTPPVPATA
jgi:predicted PurR-regulated permease PerM/methylmalonyl-CoA mutase cobalamin-binding subunit